MSKSRTKKNIVWILAVLITLSAAIYQRMTGPTHPKKHTIEIDNTKYSFKLKRSHTNSEDCFIELKDIPKELSGKIIFRPYPTDLDWEEFELIRNEDKLYAQLPVQPAAGKIEYYLELDHNNEKHIILKETPVIIRFKGYVPNIYLVPHILFMFFAMLFSNAMGLMVLFKDKTYKKYLFISFSLLVIGGLILGPIVQNFAFGDFWTGWPNGKDLTDNKTLISVIFFIIAIIGNIKRDRPYLVLLAAIMLLLIYSIPHSLMGSEFDHTTGKVITG